MPPDALPTPVTEQAARRVAGLLWAAGTLVVVGTLGLGGWVLWGGP